MKFVYIIIFVIVVAAATFLGYKIYHRTQIQKSFVGAAGGNQTNRIDNEEGGIPQSGDLCGGTGGIGQIVGTGNNTIIIKRRDNEKSQIIDLTSQTVIKTSSGSASASDLKIGDRVTLVGYPHPDGSFTAHTVLVCK